MKILILFISGFLVLMPMTVMGAAKVYRTPTIPPPNSGIQFFVPYTFGTHEGEVRMITGSLSLDLADPSMSRGDFSVPISSMTTHKAQRDCHMMEALGLDYGDSDFPEEHVCNDDDEVPTAGKNAIKYPTINLKIHSIKSLEPSKIIYSDKETNIEVDGEWLIHGKKYQWLFPMRLIPEGEKFRVKGEVPFSLKNHDVVVKPIKVLFMNIAVKDNIKTNFDLILEAIN